MSQIDSGSEIVVCARASRIDVSVTPRLRMISTSGAPTATVGHHAGDECGDDEYAAARVRGTG